MTGAGDDIAHRLTSSGPTLPGDVAGGPASPAPKKKPFIVDSGHADVVEDLAVLLRGRRGDLARAYRALETAAEGGSPRIIHWESGSANQLSIRSRRL